MTAGERAVCAVVLSLVALDVIFLLAVCSTHTSARPPVRTAAVAAAVIERKPPATTTIPKPKPRVAVVRTVPRQVVLPRATEPPGTIDTSPHEPAGPIPVVSGPTGWAALDAAIAEIPNMQPGIVRWVVKDTGDWANTDLSTGTVYVAPRAPANLLYSIVAHEYAHVLQGRIYGGMDAAIQALEPYFGNVGELAIERAADCMAILEGASWTNYTNCQNAAWRSDAAVLLSGRRL